MKRYLMVCFMAGFVLLTFLNVTVFAKLKHNTVMYQDGIIQLEGEVFYDQKRMRKYFRKEQAPGLLIVHQWRGITDYERGRAKQLAGMGYVVFLADIYGQGVRPKSTKEAGQQSALYKKDRVLMRKRVNLALKELKNHTLVHAEQTAAIGYCFGGTVVLELARSGAEVRGVVSFHGGLETPTPNDAKNIKGEVLVFHGADDPHVPWTDVTAFQKEMRDHHVDWQMTMYGKAVHAFSQKHAGNDPSKGVAYQAKADRRSFAEMSQFFNELFKR